MKLILYIVLVAGIRCYQSGPPASQCSSMTPSHDMGATSGTGNYTVTAGNRTFGPGASVRVVIGTPAVGYRGLLLQARNTINGNAVGTWARPTSTKYKHIACSTPMGAIGHANANTINTSQTFTWTAPTTGNSNVTFYATVVRVKNTFYVKIPSTRLTFVAATALPNTRPTVGTRATVGTPATTRASAHGVTASSIAIFTLAFVSVFWPSFA